MTSKLVIRESESPRPSASSILILRMTSSSVIIPYWLIWFGRREVRLIFGTVRRRGAGTDDDFRSGGHVHVQHGLHAGRRQQAHVHGRPVERHQANMSEWVLGFPGQISGSKDGQHDCLKTLDL